ncbi:MAG: GNAT family N-acetyltransferase [Faecousia sp.]
MNYLHKGKLFCLKYEDQNIGYCMVSTGKCGRYTYAGKNDITVGPIYIKSDFRGRGLSKVLLNAILEYYASVEKKEKAYAYIHRINKQSNALFSGRGFTVQRNLQITRIFRKVRITDKENTDYRLYCLNLKDDMRKSAE